MARKPRILMVNEFSRLNTGFSTYGHEVLSRLHATGKYEIAELASYLSQDDPAQDSLEWKVYPVMPGKNSDPDYARQFNAVRTAQFGELVFNRCLLDFQPDIVFSIRDPWFDEFILRNPLRENFKFAWMVTCDGEPQKMEWLEWYSKADYILTYSEWAKNLLTNNGIKVSGVFSPGSNLSLYKPDRDNARKKFNLPLEWNIVQTVMRNQPRKLYPDLFHSFALFLADCKANNQNELADNTFLHIHTSLDDVGYDIEEEIFKYGLDHKVLLTYIDEATRQPYLSFYAGRRAVSQITPGGFAFTPNTVHGVNKEQLATIHQMADLYIQYSVCEGWGMPLVDAKACGVTTMVVPYSAMMEMGTAESGGISTDIAALCQETKQETGQLRARPNNKVTAIKMREFFVTGDNFGGSGRYNRDARGWCESKKLDWSDVAKRWEMLFDSIDISTLPGWKRAADIKKPTLQLPPNMSNDDFVTWAYNNILCRPHLLTQTVKAELVKQLNRGIKDTPTGPTQFTQSILAQDLYNGCQNLNSLENTRYIVCNGLTKPKNAFSAVVV